MMSLLEMPNFVEVIAIAEIACGKTNADSYAVKSIVSLLKDDMSEL